MSDIDTAVVDSLIALDPNQPIREADIPFDAEHVRSLKLSGHPRCAYRCLLMTLNGHAGSCNFFQYFFQLLNENLRAKANFAKTILRISANHSLSVAIR